MSSVSYVFRHWVYILFPFFSFSISWGTGFGACSDDSRVLDESSVIICDQRVLCARRFPIVCHASLAGVATFFFPGVSQEELAGQRDETFCGCAPGKLCVDSREAQHGGKCVDWTHAGSVLLHLCVLWMGHGVRPVPRIKGFVPALGQFQEL